MTSQVHSDSTSKAASASSGSKRRRSDSPDTPRRKTPNACERCRQKKIKCSGQMPCQHCLAHNAQCSIKDVGKRVLISESQLKYLQELASRNVSASSVVNNSGSTAAPLAGTPPSASSQPHRTEQQVRAQSEEPSPNESVLFQIEEHDGPPVLNPLTSTGSRLFFLTDSSGRQRYLGHSSTWSFSFQVRSFLSDYVGEDKKEILVPQSEAATYSMASVPFHKAGPFNDLDFPTFEYAEFLANTTSFHLGSTYHFFDKERFMQRMARAYSREGTYIFADDLWHAQFLLVIAFGKLILGRGASDFGPPGATEFLRAMKYMPDVSGFYHEDPILGVEIICLSSLYLFSADMRNAAYASIGQAQRICLSLGMNREIPVGILTESEREHRRRLWWTVHILDRKLSINMGSPLSGLQDEDIDVSLPNLKSHTVPSEGLSLHVKVTRLTGMVMMAAYRLNGSLNRAFLRGIQDVFSAMADLAKDFSGSFDISLNNPSSVSRAAATLHLSYYQCTILATRPILFTLVQKRLEVPVGGPSAQRTPSEPVLAVLKTCIGAASTSLYILSILHGQGLIEPFLPFDLEAIFSSSFVIILATIAYPGITIDENCLTIATKILNWMCSNGNMPAVSRKSDLEQLQNAATKINSEYGISGSADRPTVQNHNWLWEALDIDRETAKQSSTPNTSILLMEPDASISDSMLEEEWLWAGTDLHDLSGPEAF